MFILSPITSGLEFWLVNHTSIYKNSELTILKNIKVLGELFNTLPNNLLGVNVDKTLESSW